MVMLSKRGANKAINSVISPIKESLDVDYFSYCSYRQGECEYISSNFNEISEFVDDLGTNMPVEKAGQSTVLTWGDFSSSDYLSKVFEKHCLSTKGVTFVLRHSQTEAEHISLNTHDQNNDMINTLRSQPNLMKSIINHIRNQVNFNKKNFDCLTFKKEIASQDPVVNQDDSELGLYNREYIVGFNGPTYLTRSENKCLLLLLQMKTSKEIARDISTTPRTVESHVASIKQKLGARQRHDLFVIAKNNFLIAA